LVAQLRAIRRQVIEPGQNQQTDQTRVLNFRHRRWRYWFSRRKKGPPYVCWHGVILEDPRPTNERISSVASTFEPGHPSD
jgi:hypothetical protein